MRSRGSGCLFRLSPPASGSGTQRSKAANQRAIRRGRWRLRSGVECSGLKRTESGTDWRRQSANQSAKAQTRNSSDALAVSIVTGVIEFAVCRRRRNGRGSRALLRVRRTHAKPRMVRGEARSARWLLIPSPSRARGAGPGVSPRWNMPERNGASAQLAERSRKELEACSSEGVRLTGRSQVPGFCRATGAQARAPSATRKHWLLGGLTITDYREAVRVCELGRALGTGPILSALRVPDRAPPKTVPTYP